MISILQKIETFNKEAGLLDRGYDDFKENEYPIEEALEGFDTRHLAKLLHIDEDSTPKEISRAIVTGSCNLAAPISDVDRFDKHLDILVFTFGSLLKMGLKLPQILKGLDVVMNANLSKLSAPLDSHGKQTKPLDWTGPEEFLELILREK